MNPEAGEFRSPSRRAGGICRLPSSPANRFSEGKDATAKAVVFAFIGREPNAKMAGSAYAKLCIGKASIMPPQPAYAKATAGKPSISKNTFTSIEIRTLYKYYLSYYMLVFSGSFII